MKKLVRMFIIPILLISLVGCASSGAIRTGKDTYVITKRSMQVGMGRPVMAEAAVYREANEFCARQNKTMEVVEIDVQNSAFARPGSVSLHFRCVEDDASSEE